MKRELPYYEVDGKYGWDQDDFPGMMMKLGGCAAVAACDSCIYFARYKGIPELYPYNIDVISREDYLRFAEEMKPFLSPRAGGINRLEMYIDGFNAFLNEKQCSRISMKPLSGSESLEMAEKALRNQIDQGFPIPILLLLHRDKKFKDYNWHWFTLAGYQEEDGAGAEKNGSLQVEAISYGQKVWFNFQNLWETGHEHKGGLILFSF